MSPDETNLDLEKIQEMINVFKNVQKYEKKIIYKMSGAIQLTFAILLLTAGAVDFVISYFIYWPNILTFVFWMIISSTGWFISHILTKNFTQLRIALSLEPFEKEKKHGISFLKLMYALGFIISIAILVILPGYDTRILYIYMTWPTVIGIGVILNSLYSKTEKISKTSLISGTILVIVGLSLVLVPVYMLGLAIGFAFFLVFLFNGLSCYLMSRKQ